MPSGDAAVAATQALGCYRAVLAFAPDPPHIAGVPLHSHVTPPDPPPAMHPPSSDRYTIERELGHGGMATVYL
ncbi:MAG: hypothetical protein ACREOQ_00660, partial [Gemmatimonadales bacterium]